MGLFGKKKNKEAKMDVPPPPPPEEGENVQPAEAPMKKDDSKEELPELPPMDIESSLPSELPEIKSEEGKKKEEALMPEFPDMPEEKDEEPEEEDAPEETPEKPEYEKEEIEEPKKILQPAGPKFMPVTKFQTVLTEAEEIKSSIKETEEVISRVKTLRAEEEKEFEKWRTHLEGVEKKLSYIDSMIFKGE